jgi:hypothetical protein
MIYLIGGYILIGAILLLLIFMIVRYYGIWNVLIYGPLIALIPLLISAGWAGGLLLTAIIPILGIFYIVLNIIRYFVDKNPPVNNSRSNNRSNNTRTSITNY